MSKPQIVYALINPAMPGLIKIGKTTQEDISTRTGQLYSTGVPVPFECIYAAQVDDCSKAESALHTAFGPYRINPNREFFKIEPEQAIAILELLGPNNAKASIEHELNENVSQAEKDSARKLKKRPNMDFHAMGINEGDVLHFVNDEAITVIIHSSKHVKFEDRVLSLTAITRELLNLNHSIQPSPKWTFNGRLLKDIYDETYAEGDT